jgi:hypothetical protein
MQSLSRPSLIRIDRTDHISCVVISLWPDRSQDVPNPAGLRMVLFGPLTEEARTEEKLSGASFSRSHRTAADGDHNHVLLPRSPISSGSSYALYRFSLPAETSDVDLRDLPPPLRLPTRPIGTAVQSTAVRKRGCLASCLWVCHSFRSQWGHCINGGATSRSLAQNF